MNQAIENPPLALELYEPTPDLTYSIELVSQLTHLSRRQIALYCHYGLVSPIGDPESGGWLFNDEGIRRLRHIEQLRATCGASLNAIRLILELTAEVERLRQELRFWRRW